MPVGLAIAVVGAMFLVLILNSPGAWEWWRAQAVRGSEQGGVVLYSFRGGSYSTDDPAAGPSVSRPRTVYVDPAHPENAVFSVAVAQASDTAVTVGPLLIGAGFVVAGFARKRRNERNRRRAQAENPDRYFGYGLDSDVVANIISERNKVRRRDG